MILLQPIIALSTLMIEFVEILFLTITKFFWNLSFEISKSLFFEKSSPEVFTVIVKSNFYGIVTINKNRSKLSKKFSDLF